MAAKNLIKWICDLCGTSETTEELIKPPEGWVKISIDDHIQERCWHDKAICPSCLGLIAREKNKSSFNPRKENTVTGTQKMKDHDEQEAMSKNKVMEIKILFDGKEIFEPIKINTPKEIQLILNEAANEQLVPRLYDMLIEAITKVRGTNDTKNP